MPHLQASRTCWPSRNERARCAVCALEGTAGAAHVAGRVQKTSRVGERASMLIGSGTVDSGYSCTGTSVKPLPLDLVLRCSTVLVAAVAVPRQDLVGRVSREISSDAAARCRLSSRAHGLRAPAATFLHQHVLRASARERYFLLRPDGARCALWAGGGVDVR